MTESKDKVVPLPTVPTPKPEPEQKTEPAKPRGKGPQRSPAPPKIDHSPVERRTEEAPPVPQMPDNPQEVRARHFERAYQIAMQEIAVLNDNKIALKIQLATLQALLEEQVAKVAALEKKDA